MLKPVAASRAAPFLLFNLGVSYEYAVLTKICEEVSMDFTLSPKVEDLRRRVAAFMNENVYPAEKLAEEQIHASGDPHRDAPIVTEIRKKAKAEGLWNMFLPDRRHAMGLKNWEYAPLCEIMGRSPIGARAFNCMAPDTGNMEILAEFGTPEQKKRWLDPCLEGTMRTCFSMTEPETAGSDPTLLKTRAVRDGDYYVINGHKWFTSGRDRRRIRDRDGGHRSDAPAHERAPARLSFPPILPALISFGGIGDGPCGRRRPLRNPLQGLPRAGHQRARQRRAPASPIAQARLGPGRIHHCMRMIGVAERALELMCKRANTR